MRINIPTVTLALLVGAIASVQAVSYGENMGSPTINSNSQLPGSAPNSNFHQQNKTRIEMEPINKDRINNSVNDLSNTLPTGTQVPKPVTTPTPQAPMNSNMPSRP